MKYIVREYIALSSLSTWADAEMVTARDDSLQKTIDQDRALSRYYGEKIIGYHVYDDATHAEERCNQIKKVRARALAEWRHKVYGDPLPAISC